MSEIVFQNETDQIVFWTIHGLKKFPPVLREKALQIMLPHCVLWADTLSLPGTTNASLATPDDQIEAFFRILVYHTQHNELEWTDALDYSRTFRGFIRMQTPDSLAFLEVCHLTSVAYEAQIEIRNTTTQLTNWLPGKDAISA